jgi:hypothetical protein
MVDMENLKEKVNNMTEKVGEAVNLDILLPVHARTRNRYTELKKLSSAKTMKIMRGNIATFYTTPPEIFMCNLTSSIINGVGTISYQVYKSKDGKKTADIVKDKRRNSNGDEVEIIVSEEYPFKETVIETIEYRKPIKIERIKED